MIKGIIALGLLYVMGISCSSGFDIGYVINDVRFCLGAFCLECCRINDISVLLFYAMDISCSSGLNYWF